MKNKNYNYFLLFSFFKLIYTNTFILIFLSNMVLKFYVILIHSYLKNFNNQIIKGLI